MKRTHLSLYYLASYVTISGLALVLMPGLTLNLFLSNGNYGEVLPRLLGVVLLALAIFIWQIIRHNLEVLYPTTLVARGMILAVLIALYFYSHDPFFIVLLLVVGFGFVLTGVCYWLDRQTRTTTAQSHT